MGQRKEEGGGREDKRGDRKRDVIPTTRHINNSHRTSVLRQQHPNPIAAKMRNPPRCPSTKE